MRWSISAIPPKPAVAAAPAMAAQILLGGGAAASRGMRGLDARVCGPQDQIPALGPDLAGHRGDPP